MFYPLSIVFYFLPFHVVHPYMMAINLFLMGIFFYMYLRLIKISKFSSFFSVVIFVFSGIVVLWSGIASFINALIWFPLLLYLTERLIRKKYKIGVVAALIYHHEKVPSLVNLLKKKYYYALKAHRFLKKNKTPVLSAKTIYFLRPVFYKNWRKLISNPKLSLGMFTMLFLEQGAGLVGYLVGLIKNE